MSEAVRLFKLTEDHECGTCGRKGGHAPWCPITKATYGLSNARCGCLDCIANDPVRHSALVGAMRTE